MRDGKDVCYLKTGEDFIVFGFDEATNPAHVEGSTMHPVAWTITSLDEGTEAKIADLIKKAAG